ncbi:hypothetical protein, partial [Serratia nevei]|uniref:hypothetical protein n=1 Tax=Serratia nevei TaxID=2703794 RepID=UPI00254E0F5F
RPGCQKACVLPENPASYRVVRTKSYLFNKAPHRLSARDLREIIENLIDAWDIASRHAVKLTNSYKFSLFFISMKIVFI